MAHTPALTGPTSTLTRSTRLAALVWTGVLIAGTAASAQPSSPNDAQQPPIQARPGGPESAPQTDEERPVTKGTRLVISNNAGEVVVRSWDRDAVRVQATHSARESVNIETADQTMRIRARSQRGPSGLVDYRITVPSWMPVNLSGTYLEAAIEGTSAEVTVETVHGNVRVVGGSGSVVVRSVEGLISVDKAAGRVQATTVNEGIRLTNVTGDMTAETTNGDIEIQDAQTSSLEASTVNGDITFNGTVRAGGSYRLTTHGGDVRVGLGGAANATVFVRTFQGDFSSDFPIELPEGQSRNSGSKRFNFTLGNGSARIEVQSFNGDIHLAKGTVTSQSEERNRRRGRGASPNPKPAPPTPPVPPAPAKPPKPPGDFDAFADEYFDAIFKSSLLPELEIDLDLAIETGIAKALRQRQ